MGPPDGRSQPPHMPSDKGWDRCQKGGDEGGNVILTLIIMFINLLVITLSPHLLRPPGIGARPHLPDAMLTTSSRE